MRLLLLSSWMRFANQSHLLEEAEPLCQRTWILKNSSIVAEASLEELQKPIPALEIIVVKTDKEGEVIVHAKQHNFIPRLYNSDLAFGLPER